MNNDAMGSWDTQQTKKLSFQNETGNYTKSSFPFSPEDKHIPFLVAMEKGVILAVTIGWRKTHLAE